MAVVVRLLPLSLRKCILLDYWCGCGIAVRTIYRGEQMYRQHTSTRQLGRRERARALRLQTIQWRCWLTPGRWLSQQWESIIFTKEKEDEQQLPFLDCLISRTPGGGFTSKVHKKPMATDRFLRFDPHHPLTVKRGLIKCLTTRARKLCSTEESEKAEKRHISKALQCNNYPRYHWSVLKQRKRQDPNH